MSSPAREPIGAIDDSVPGFRIRAGGTGDAWPLVVEAVQEGAVLRRVGALAPLRVVLDLVEPAFGPGVGQTPKKALAIVNQAEKTAELLEILGARAGEIEDISETQKKVNEDLDSSIRKNQP